MKRADRRHPLSLPDYLKHKDPNELIRIREELRASGDFETADLIRDYIASLGYKIEDTISGPRIVEKKIGWKRKE